MNDLHKAALNWYRATTGPAGAIYTSSRDTWSFAIHAPSGGTPLLVAILDGVPVRSEVATDLNAAKKLAEGMLSAAQSMAWHKLRDVPATWQTSFDGVTFGIRQDGGIYHTTMTTGAATVALGEDKTLAAAKKRVSTLVDAKHPPKTWAPMAVGPA